VALVAHVRALAPPPSAAAGGAAAVDALAALEAALTQLRDDYADEYALYGLGALAVAAVAPYVRARMAAWDPLRAPEQDMALFEGWRHLLQTTSDKYASGWARTCERACEGASVCKCVFVCLSVCMCVCVCV
jgi:hypothetical protein